MRRDVNFYPDRGRAAWPEGCPCCGEVLREFEPETETEWPLWTFECGCEIYFDEGMPFVEEDCPDAMNQHIEGVVIHTQDPA